LRRGTVVGIFASDENGNPFVGHDTTIVGVLYPEEDGPNAPQITGTVRVVEAADPL
jgi:hypothetical protein